MALEGAHRRHTDTGDFCEDHLSLALNVGKLGSRMTLLIALMGGNCILLMAIFTALITTGSYFSRVDVKLETLKGDVLAIQVETRPLPAIIATQQEY